MIAGMLSHPVHRAGNCQHWFVVQHAHDHWLTPTDDDLVFTNVVGVLIKNTYSIQLRGFQNTTNQFTPAV
jgi:hypothetical protein